MEFINSHNKNFGNEVASVPPHWAPCHPQFWLCRGKIGNRRKRTAQRRGETIPLALSRGLGYYTEARHLPFPFVSWAFRVLKWATGSISGSINGGGIGERVVTLMRELCPCSHPGKPA